MRAQALPELPLNRNLTPAEIYCSAWGKVNKHVDFAIRQDELFYLRTIALSLDDDLASLLLLKKLKLARKFAAAEDEPQVVGMNSYVELRFGEGNRRFCQLLHPTMCASSFALSISSRLGAGVVGLRAGEVLLWPDEDGSPRDLHVIAVNNTGRRKAQLLPPDDLPPSAA
jgi:regulator of nucleoside diphosphate kinase